MTKTLAAVGLAVGISAAAGVSYARRNADAPIVGTEAVTRGAVVRAISATGTLEAVTTVAVGTQISGSIQALHADFNAIVRKGQTLARLDPALYRSTLVQAQANLARAAADFERTVVVRDDAGVKAVRARELSARQLLPGADLDAAEVAVRSAAAQVLSAEAQVRQAKAAVAQAEVNLAKTVIVSPIDGIVIARNVDVGQTVAASLSAPTLFVLAAGLDRMHVNANIDESDLGAIAEGQTVIFTVDAYPRDTFTGTVEQVRLNPVVQQNVVTYAAIIEAANPGLKLKPGMTANVTVEVARRDGVLRVPAAALRFKPTDVVKEALGATEPGPSGPAVWEFAGGRLMPRPVKTGASDGLLTEISGEDLAEGTQVVTRVTTAAEAATTPARPASSPLMPAGQRR